MIGADDPRVLRDDPDPGIPACTPVMKTVEGLRALVVPIAGELRDVVLTWRDGGYFDDIRRHAGAAVRVRHVRGPVGVSLWLDYHGIEARPPRPPNVRIGEFLLSNEGWSVRSDVVITGAAGPDLDPTSLHRITAEFLRQVLEGADEQVGGR